MTNLKSAEFFFSAIYLALIFLDWPLIIYRSLKFSYNPTFAYIVVKALKNVPRHFQRGFTLDEWKRRSFRCTLPKIKKQLPLEETQEKRN